MTLDLHGFISISAISQFANISQRRA